MQKGVWRVLKTISTLLVALIVILAIMLVGVRLVNVQVFTVLSGSMEPTYHVGALLYVKEVDTDTLQIGDPITYAMSDNTIVTHRIVDIIPADDGSGTVFYQTKGDANNVVDGTLTADVNVLGKPIFSIPKLGYMLTFVQRPPGLYVGIVVCAVIIFFVFALDMLANEAKKENHK